MCSYPDVFSFHIHVTNQSLFRSCATARSCTGVLVDEQRSVLRRGHGLEEGADDEKVLTTTKNVSR